MRISLTDLFSPDQEWEIAVDDICGSNQDKG